MNGRPTRWFMMVFAMGISAVVGGLIVSRWNLPPSTPLTQPGFDEVEKDIIGFDKMNAGRIDLTSPNPPLPDIENSDESIQYFPRALFPEGVVRNTSVDGDTNPQVDLTSQSGQTDTTAAHKELVSGPPDTAADGTSLVEPAPITPPRNSIPINAVDDAHVRAIRKVIRQAMPDATQEEFDIWLNELIDLTPDMVQEILEFRRTLGGNKDLFQSFQPAPSTTGHAHDSPSSAVAAPHKVSSRERNKTDVRNELLDCLQPTIQTLTRAEHLILKNIANASTVGFKRSYVLFEETGQFESGISESQLRQTSLGQAQGPNELIDQSSGLILQTGRPLDVAIRGDGWFQVRRGDQVRYTRTGRFTVDDTNNLVITIAEHHWTLEPAIVVPREISSVRILPTGIVSVTWSTTDPTWKASQIAQIQLARFANASGLKREGPCLFAETGSSGAVFLTGDGHDNSPDSRIATGCLEQANVDLSRELAELKRIKQHIDAIYQAADIIAQRRRSN